MQRPFLLALLTLVVIGQVVQAAGNTWTTSVGVPSSLRPNRAVTFTYTATSSSSLDLNVAWSVDLLTCVDTNGDGLCTSGTDASYHDFGAKALNVNAGSSGSVTWTVNLADPTGPHAYNFNPTCATPCVGQAPVTGDTKRGAFQLAYTNTWTRTITVPAFVPNGTTAAVTYKLASTSPDDQDLDGTAQLYSTPNGSAERVESAQLISVVANAQQTLSWPFVAFAPMGRQQERMADSTTTTQAFGNATVLAVQLNTTVPRAVYTSGDAFGMYVALTGRGATLEWQPLQANIQIIVRNQTFVLANTTIRTDANGTAYLGFQPAVDLAEINWTSNTTVTWNGLAFAPVTNGTIDFAPAAFPTLDLSNVTALRGDVANLSFNGTHLDTLGTHNLLLEVGRVVLEALVGFTILFLIVFVSFRV